MIVPPRALGSILLLFSVGCTSAPSSTDAGGEVPLAPAVAFLDGTRIKHVQWVADDGFRQLVGEVRDSMLGLECSFREAGDGRLRCLPVSDEVALGHGIYADAECRQPLGQTGIGHMGPRFVALVGDGCNGRSEYRETGPRFEGGEGYARVDGVCGPRRLSDPRLAYFRAGAAVPLERFVAARDVIVPRGGRLAELQRRAEDGFTARVGLFDTQEKRLCRPEAAADGTIRCLPERRYWIGAKGPYAGPACAGAKLGTEQRCPEGRAELVEDVSDEACGRVVRLYQPGPSWPAETLFAGDQAACQPYPARPQDRYVQVGTPVDPGRFVELALERVGTSRLRAARYTDRQGAVLPALESPYDSVLDEPCAFQPATDGHHYCIPALATLFFTDQACNQPFIATFGGACPRNRTRFALWRGRYHERGAKLGTPQGQVFRQDPDGCKALSLADSTADFYALGAEVSAGFVAGARVGR